MSVQDYDLRHDDPLHYVDRLERVDRELEMVSNSRKGDLGKIFWSNLEKLLDSVGEKKQEIYAYARKGDYNELRSTLGGN